MRRLPIAGSFDQEGMRPHRRKAISRLLAVVARTAAQGLDGARLYRGGREGKPETPNSLEMILSASNRVNRPHIVRPPLKRMSGSHQIQGLSPLSCKKRGQKRREGDSSIVRANQRRVDGPDCRVGKAIRIEENREVGVQGG